MRKFSFCLLILLAGCKTSGIVLEENAPAPQTRARSEPVFYNGKTYHLDFSHAAGVFNMKVSGMNGRQEKDALAVATSGLRYFACPDGQSGKALGAAKFSDRVWTLRARCV